MGTYVLYVERDIIYPAVALLMGASVGTALRHNLARFGKALLRFCFLFSWMVREKQTT